MYLIGGCAEHQVCHMRTAAVPRATFSTSLATRATAPPSFGNLQDKKRREMARVVPVALETLWSSRGGGNNRIRSVTFDPSHTAVAASCADGHVRIYEAATGQ